MTILDRLLSALGLGGTDRANGETSEPTVTVEHDPDASDEGAVKGVDAAAEEATEPGETPETDEWTNETDETPAADEGVTPPDETTEVSDETPETQETTDDEGAGESVETVKGIGPAYAEQLGAAGVETVADLAETDAADLAGRTSISEKRVGRWIERARERRE